MSEPLDLPAVAEQESQSAPMDTEVIPAIDYKAFVTDVQALHVKLKAGLGADDLAQGRRLW